jgi:vancomycin resistance protein YoaR
MLHSIKQHRKIIAGAVAAIALVGILNFLWQTGSPPEDADTIYANVYIHEVLVGGMNREEANAALTERFLERLLAQTVSYAVESEVKAEFTFADFGARFDFSPLVELALEYSHSPSFSQRATRIFRSTYEITDSPIFIFSAERLDEIIQNLSNELDTPVQNAALQEKDGKVSLTKEATGQGIDTVLAAEATQEILQGLQGGTVELKIITIEPQYTTANFDFVPKLLGTFETPCACSNDEARCRNITRAAGRIHNVVVYPGQVFSAGELIGAHLPNSGYETATVIVRGKQVEDIGGGVCQVVTTLYNAVLRSELEIVQRHNHSARVSYVDVGLDATVAGDYYDLKFKNNTDYAVLITAAVERDMLRVRIYGNDTRDPSRTGRFEVRQVELLTPEPYREVVDPAIPLGQRMVTLESQMGYHVELFKIVYLHGAPVEEVKINTSVYKPLQGIIAIGAG